MSATASRTLPHSIEAEENLLSCILLDGADGADVVSRCIEARIRPESFYDPKHGTVFEVLLSLYNTQKPIAVSVVAEELKMTKQLDTVGGYAFLTRVSSRVATTAQAGYFIEKVREQATLREIIRSTTQVAEDCYGYTGNIEAFCADVTRKMGDSVWGKTPNAGEWKLADLLAFDTNNDADSLMGRRFLCRSGGCVIVAPSGIGKSVLSLQLAACAALGRPFFGVRMNHAMRVLYVQAEDDQGDVAEAAKGIVAHYELTKSEVEALGMRLRVVRWNDAAGEKFLARLRREHGKWPFDLVVINPLFSFAGCDLSSQAELSPFLRNGLNPILTDTGAACIIVHHTNKPPTDKKEGKEAVDSELRYVGSGSAELTNWARGYITLQNVRAAGGGVFKMAFVKRGTRAGIVDAEGRPTTSVLIEHAPKGLCWLPSDHAPSNGAGGKFALKFNLSRAATVFDSSLDWKQNEAAIALDQNVDRKTVYRHRQTLLDTAA